MSNGHGSWAFHRQNHRFQALSGVNPSSKSVSQYVSYRGPSSQIINMDGFPQLYTSITSGMFQQRLQYRLEETWVTNDVFQEILFNKPPTDDVFSNKPQVLSGWWFQPLWKILISWGYYSQYMKKSCSKAPTSCGSNNYKCQPHLRQLLRCACNNFFTSSCE